MKRRDHEPGTPAPDAPRRERREPSAPAPHPVLALQAAAGNAATAWLLQRQVSEAEPNASYAEEGEYAPGDQVTVNALSPEDQRKLTYARSILARVEPLPAADEEVLRKLVPGTLIMQLIQQRDDQRKRLQDLVAEQDARLGKGAPANRWMGPTDPTGDPDILGGSPFVGESLAGVIDEQRKRVEELDAAIAQACQALGIPGEKEFRELVESRFPDLFLARAKTIALRMLDENERLVRAEAKRMGVELGPWEGTGAGSHAGAPPGPAEMEVLAGVRAAAQELHTMQVEKEEGWENRVAVNEENIRRADEEDYDWRTDENSYWAPDLSQQGQSAAEEHARREAAFVQRRNELGLKYPILFRVDDYSDMALASDEQIQAMTGSKLRELLENIAETRGNIAEGELKVWNLNEVFDITMQDLGITPSSPLYAAVEKRVAEEERDESILNIAKTALGIAAAIVGAVATGGLSIVATGVAVSVGVSQLAESVSSFLAEGAAGDISLDPVMADISRKSPDLKAVALDLAGLGLDAFDLVRIVKLIAAPVRAARRTGDLMQLSTELRAIEGLGERGVETVMATVGREAEIQAGVVRLVKAVGTRFRPADLAQVVADLERYDHKVVAEALKDLIAAGRVRVLSRASFAEVYKSDPARMKAAIKRGLLQANGLLDKTHGVLFLREATLESMSSSALHEVVHFLQDVHRPLMSQFHREFEAYAAQRHYLQQLSRSGVDPDMAFPSYRWLMEASNEDIVAHLARHKLYGLTPDPGLNLDDAVIDALASLTRSQRVAEGAEAATEAATKATKQAAPPRGARG